MASVTRRTARCSLAATLAVATAAVATTTSIGAAGAATTVSAVWTRNLGGIVRESSPLLVDLNGDGVLDVVVGSHDARLNALDGATGAPLAGWPVSTGNAVDSSPSVADVDNDQQPELFVGAGTSAAAAGALYSFERNGAQRFRKVLTDIVFPAPSVHASPAIGEMNGDGGLDVVFTTLGLQSLWAVDADGRTHPGFPHYWSDTMFASPALVNIDADPKLEIIAGGDSTAGFQDYHDGGMVRAIDNDGTELWEYRINDIVRSSPSVADLDGDGRAEVVFGSGDFWGGTDSTAVFAVDAKTGALKWRRSTDGVTNGSPALADVDGDGHREVVIGTFNSNHGRGAGGSVYVLDGATGAVRPGFPVASGGGVVHGGVTTADIDGDGGQDAVVTTGGLIAVFDGSSGARLFNLAEGQGTGFQNSATLGDIDGDGLVDIVAGGFKGGAGVVLRWELSAPAKLGSNGWHQFRYDNQRTGSAFAEAPPRPALPIERVSGADRYATAVALSERAGAARIVYVASGASYADALAGGPASVKAAATLLLTSPTALSAATRQRIVALAPDRIVVLGGSAAVSDAVLAELVPLAANGATRVSGTNRYETAAAISAGVFNPGVPVAYVVTGQNFPDALSAANAAAKEGGPVLLTEANLLPPATAAELTRLNPGQVVIVGGTSSVSAAVATAVDALVAGPVVRVSGLDRYATAAAVSARSFPGGAAKAFLATGSSFPDALAGGPVAAREGAPLLLVPGACSPAVVTTEIDRLGVTGLVLLGGSGVLSSGLATLPAC